MRALVVVLVLAVSGCASVRDNWSTPTRHYGPRPQSKLWARSDFVYWTRHFERQAGTRQHVVLFIEKGEKSPLPWCAWSCIGLGVECAPSPIGQRLQVVYDLNCERGSLIVDVPISEYVLARHEVMHERAHHHERLCAVEDGEEVHDGKCIGIVRAEIEVAELEAQYQ